MRGAALGISATHYGLSYSIHHLRLRLALSNPTIPTLFNSQLTNFKLFYSKPVPQLLRAPKGGVTIGGKRYLGGQFIPRPRLRYGTTANSFQYKGLTWNSGWDTPALLNYGASPILRWSVGIGGSSLVLYHGYKEMTEE